MSEQEQKSDNIFKTIKVDFVKHKEVNGKNGPFVIWSIKSENNWYDCFGNLTSKNTLQPEDLKVGQFYKVCIALDHTFNDKIIWIGEPNKPKNEVNEANLSELNHAFEEFVNEYKGITLHPVLEDFILKYYEKFDGVKYTFLVETFNKSIKR